MISFEVLITSLGVAAAASGAITSFINQFVKPILNNITSRFDLEEDQRLVMIYVVRTFITGFAILGAGGAETVRQFTGIGATVPDLALFGLTVFIITLGQEIIHPLVSYLYQLKEGYDTLREGWDDLIGDIENPTIEADEVVITENDNTTVG